MEAAIQTDSVPDAAFEAGVTRAGRPRILSLCCLYPNPLLPGQGLFVERRIQHLARLTEVKVVAPFALVQYGDQSGHRFRFGERGCPVRRQAGGVDVWHPRWFYPPLSGSFTPLWLFARLLPVLRRMRAGFAFDVIDAHFGFPDGIAAALLASALRVPFTVTLRGNEPKHSQGTLGRFWMRWTLRRAALVFAVSERLRRFAIDLGTAPEKTLVAPNGVDPAVFFRRDRSVARRHGLDPDRPLIVSAGALVERKGHHRIVEALAGLHHDGPEPQLAIVGGPGPEGNFDGELRRIVDASGLGDRVRFCGALPPAEVAEMMSAADVFCLASSNEGWPNVVHEALACGAPVVATDVGAVPEMLADGRRGIIVPVNDPVALRLALEQALAKSWDRDGIAAWAQSRTWPQVAREVLEGFAIAGVSQRAAAAR